MIERDTNLAEPLKPQLGMSRCYAPLTHLALFNGIGGFQLAADWAGWQNIAHVEINDWCNKVVKQHFPNSKCYTDIINFDGTEYANAIDVISGGFPCQPYSLAGKRKGKEDERHLWPEMLRTIRQVKPRYVVGENVYGLLNWDGGLVFNEVQTDLENEGFEVQPVILPACGINAPHRRERIWFIAYNANARVKSLQQQRENGIYKTGTITNTESEQSSCFKRECSEQEQRKSGRMGIEANVFTNPERFGQQEQRQPERPLHTKTNKEWKASWAYDDGRWPTQSPVCGRDDGVSYRLDRLKALGNAIVPQNRFSNL